ncbi:MAG: hypothetical protein LBS36_03780 [Oscillospiraceae bacterium]|nr:hypothetical protein [Oscillospiraceae bacterium]
MPLYLHAFVNMVCLASRVSALFVAGSAVLPPVFLLFAVCVIFAAVWAFLPFLLQLRAVCLIE